MTVKLMAAARLIAADTVLARVCASSKIKASKLELELAKIEKQYADLQKSLKGLDADEIDGKDLEQLRKLGDAIKRTREALD